MVCDEPAPDATCVCSCVAFLCFAMRRTVLTRVFLASPPPLAAPAPRPGAPRLAATVVSTCCWDRPAGGRKGRARERVTAPAKKTPTSSVWVTLSSLEERRPIAPPAATSVCGAIPWAALALNARGLVRPCIKKQKCAGQISVARAHSPDSGGLARARSPLTAADAVRPTGRQAAAMPNARVSPPLL